MLTITIPETELFDEKTQEFIYIKSQTINLEHSLVSISKWESKWHKPFLSTEKTPEEMLDYIKCMTITQNVKPEIFLGLTEENIKDIEEYMSDPKTATWFSEKTGKGRNREVVTAEIIYYWMIANNIPTEYRKWHINQLITLIRVCSEKNAPPKKMSKRDIASRNINLNNARRKAMNSKG